jgi:hypothetical protein
MKKYKKYLLLFSALLTLIFFTGCDPTTITQTLYLQDIKIEGPVSQPPLHITKGQKSGTVTVSPKITINSQKSVAGRIEGHTNVNSHGLFQVDTLFEGNGTWIYQESIANRYTFDSNNLTWSLPEASMGFDLDLCLSDHFALSGGLNYIVINQNSLVGGSVGLGFFSEKDGHSLRFDGGLLWQSLYYDAATVMVTTTDPPSGPTTTEVIFFRDRDKSSSVNLFTSLTYNSVFDNFPVNFFINLGYFSQSLADFEPGETDIREYPFSYTTKILEDTRGEASTAFFNITPGIYTDINQFSRLIFGLRMLNETQLEQASESFYILPVIQLDMHF